MLSESVLKIFSSLFTVADSAVNINSLHTQYNTILVGRAFISYFSTVQFSLVSVCILKFMLIIFHIEHFVEKISKTKAL